MLFAALCFTAAAFARNGVLEKMGEQYNDVVVPEREKNGIKPAVRMK